MNWPNENSVNQGTRKTSANSKAPYRRGGLRVFSITKEFYSSGQAARLLGIPSRTLRRYLSIGKIEGRQNPITQTWQIPSESLVKFIDEQGGKAVIEQKEISVLIVDGRKSIGDLFRRMAESPGRTISILEFQEVGDALIESGVIKPDLIVIDTSTPLFDGTSLLRLLSANPHTHTAKILAVTDDPERIQQIEEEGAASVLVKPFSYTDLVQTIEYLFPDAAELPS